MTPDALLHYPAFGLPQQDKDAHLLPRLRDLTRHHALHCPPYGKIVHLTAPGYAHATSLADLPFLPVSLFKHRLLSSVPQSAIRSVVTSSGTSGQPSRVPLDAETARLQSLALAHIMQDVLGASRLPMLILDSETTITRRDHISARAAAILGLMPLGFNHTFALDDAMRPRPAQIAAFLEKHAHRPVMIFGFTFMVWSCLGEALRGGGLDLSQAVLLHGGGWKKLQDQAVDHATLRQTLRREFGLTRIYNFYGMAEQIGSICVEGDDGLLYPPSFADILIRDPVTLQPLPHGETGLIQMLCPLPRSYPGHSILTEDLGRIEKTDGARKGKGFTVLGRLPRAPLRGCSDVHAFKVSL